MRLETWRKDIGEEDRLMSRLEAEMQVYTEDAGEYTLGLLDKGNGKARGIRFFVWGVGRLKTWIVVSFFYMMNPPHRKMNQCCLKKKRIFQQEDSLDPHFSGHFFFSFQGDFSSAAIFFLLHRFKRWICVGATLLSDLAD